MEGQRRSLSASKHRVSIWFINSCLGEMELQLGFNKDECHNENSRRGQQAEQ